MLGGVDCLAIEWLMLSTRAAMRASEGLSLYADIDTSQVGHQTGRRRDNYRGDGPIMTDEDRATSLASERSEAGQSEAGQSQRKRDSLWASAAETCTFIREAHSDKSIVLRDEDRNSSRVLSAFLFVGLAALCLGAYQQDWAWLRTRLGAGGFTPFRPINLIVLGGIDILYFLPLCWFVVRRMGILRTMSKRHALICCQLMIGASILTALICVNIAVMILVICLGNQMKLLVG